MNKAIAAFLTSPRKVAHSLDWKKSTGCLLSLKINKERLEIAVASHPSYHEPIQPLPSIPISLETRDNRKVLSAKVTNELATILEKYEVCGMIVNWPVEKDGWCGYKCGLALNVMDQLSVHPGIMNGSRTVCLWDPEHRTMLDDEWGRLPVYGAPPPATKTLHFASLEQYRDSKSAAADVWNDFCKNHWPEFYRSNGSGNSQTTYSRRTIKNSLAVRPPSLKLDSSIFERSSSKTSAFAKATAAL